MTQPAVIMNELDSALGVLPASEGALLALVGTSTRGPQNTPVAYGRVRDVVASFGGGPLVEAAAYSITKFGRPVLLVRTGDTAAGVCSSVTVSRAATAAPSTAMPSVSGVPNDDYEFFLQIVDGGELDTAATTFRWSLDGGRTLSEVTAPGMKDTFEFPGSGVTLTLGESLETLSAGDVMTWRGTAPQWSPGELTTALTALRDTTTLWEIVHVLGALDGAGFDALDTAVSGMASRGKDRMFIAHTRMPDARESPAEYKTALDSVFSSRASVWGSVCAGSAKIISGVSGRQYRRPASWFVAPQHATSSEETNLANVKVGRMEGVSIVDRNGNADDHDETVNPGLDDSRFLVLRSWEGRPGVYVNRPRLFSSPTSDYQLIPHRRVINIAKRVIRNYLEERVNEEILVDRKTGNILESEALEIEAGANAALRSALLGKPKASGARFTLSRTDNLLATKTLNGDVRVVPLAYPEFIKADIGFENPAIAARAV